MFVLYVCLICLLSYALGSIPSAVWFGKKFYHIDVREHGSKNAGATNTFRVLGKKAGIPVLLFDILKGFIAVQLVYLLKIDNSNFELISSLKILFGACAILGHIFPVFAKFKGGKGVATLGGVIAAVHPTAWIISLGVFLIILIISRYVSLSSIIAALAFPFLIIFILSDYSVVLNVFAIAIAVLILFMHRKNIVRLMRGEETKVKFSQKNVK